MEPVPNHKNFLRLSKLMALRGICSRREADSFIKEGQVIVDGAVISTLGTKVSPDADIRLSPQARRFQSDKVTILLHKPLGYVSTQPEKNYRPAIDLIIPENQYGDQLFHPGHLLKLSVAGRLDIDSKGLLVLTQDGTLVKTLIGPESTIEKEYIVRVEGQIFRDTLPSLRHGLSLDGKQLKPARVDLLEPNLLRFVLREGKKRQIRRMCELVGLDVVSLKRVRIGNVLLGDLPPGKWRYLENGEYFI